MRNAMSVPLLMRLDGRLVAIVGGGPVALRKARSLTESNARLRVVAPTIVDELRALAQTHGEFFERAYAAGDLDGAALAIAATDDDALNERVVADARAANILVNDASQPSRGDATMLATHRIGDVTIAVDSGGGTPAFSKRIIREIAEHLGPDYGPASKTLARMRTYALATLSSDERAAALRTLAEYPLAELARMNPGDAEHAVDACVRSLRNTTNLSPSGATCATRASALAIAQSRWIAARLAEHGVATRLLPVTTTGDAVQDRPLHDIGTDNVFVTEIEVALRDGRAHYAVHSAKDLPSTLPADMCLAAISAREDARDAFCSERYPSFASLPAGALVGTSSPRRRAQLQALRDDLRYEDIRGNIDTRLRKLREGTYDAIVLAMAGLRRLGIAATHTVPFELDTLVPAVAQGALAIETRSDAAPAFLHAVRAAVNDAQAERCVTCERAALRTLRGGCKAPIGIHAGGDGARLTVRGTVAALDGSRVVSARLDRPVSTLEEADALGVALAEVLLTQGAGELLERPAPLAGRFLVLPRTQDRPSRIAGALRERGAEVAEIRDGEPTEALARRVPDMVLLPSSGSVGVAAAWLERWKTSPRRPSVAAMGPQSRSAAEAAGWVPDIVPAEATIDAFVAAVEEFLSAQA